MEPSIYRYILQYSKWDQIRLLVLIVLSLPFIYFVFDVPKTIVNQAIGGEGAPAGLASWLPGQLFELGLSDREVYLWALCGLFLVLVIINGAFKYVTNVYRGMLGERILRRFRFDLYTRVLRFPLAHFKRTSSGKIIPMLTAETEPLGGFIGDAFALPAYHGGYLLTLLIFISVQDWRLGLASIVLYPMQMWLIPKLQRRVNELARQRVRTVRELTDRIGESVTTISEIHANNTSLFERARVSDRLGAIYTIRVEIFRKKFFIKFLNNFLAQLTPFFFYAIGGTMVIRGQLSLGELVAVIASYKDIAPHWKELLKYYQTLEDARVKYAQIIEQFQVPNMLDESALDSESKDAGSDDSTPSKLFTGLLVASNLTYGEDEYVTTVQGVSFRYDCNRSLAIIGRNGSGKEDLGRLLAGIIHPVRGRITIGEHALRDLPEFIIGRRIAYVDSGVQLASGSLWDNLVYGLKHRVPATDDAMVSAQDRLDVASDQRKQLAIASGNIAADIDADWIDYRAAGVDGVDALRAKAIALLRLVELDSDVYSLGLGAHIDANDELAPRLLEVRRKLFRQIEKTSLSKLITPFDEHAYNTNMSVAENIVFGTALSDTFRSDQLAANPLIADIMTEIELDELFLQTGLRIAQIMVDLFADVEPDSDLFERFSFIDSEDLPAFGVLLARSQGKSVTALGADDRQKLRQLPFQLIVGQHRLGVIDATMQEQLLKVRHTLRERLEGKNEIDFFDVEYYNAALSVQDNILFGKLAAGQTGANSQVAKMIQDSLQEADLFDDIIRLGLEYSVGTSGSRLSASQRQRIAIARALLKDPELLVINKATDVLNEGEETVLIDRILEYRERKAVICILTRSSLADKFDDVLELERGRVKAHDVPA